MSIISQPPKKRKRLIGPAEWRMVLVLTAISVICGGALALVNEGTKATIEANAKARTRSSVLVSLGVYTAAELFPKEGVPKLSADEIEKYFREHIEVIKTDSFSYWKAYKDQIGGELKGYVVRIAGSGFQGLVAMQVAISPDLKTILGAHVVEFEIGETPGLGFRMTEDQFWSQFKDMKTEPKVEFVKFRAASQAKDPHQFDAITGATFTSITIRDLINRAIVNLKQAITTEDGRRS